MAAKYPCAANAGCSANSPWISPQTPKPPLKWNLKMENPYDYKKFAVVYVDDEKMALKAFTLAFGDTFRIFTADNAQDGLKFLREQGDEIGILMTDQKMPGEKGVWLLEQA